MTDGPRPKQPPKLVDVAQLTETERVERAAAARAADAARLFKPSDAPTSLLRLAARDCRGELDRLLDEAHSGTVDLRENARGLFKVARRLSGIENELVSRKPDQPA